MAHIGMTLRKKCPYSKIFEPYFLEFGFNTEIYGVTFRIQSECEKMRIGNIPNANTFHAMIYATPL